jgi:ketopantoate reductase
MEVLVFGAGSLGSLLGGLLAAQTSLGVVGVGASAALGCLVGFGGYTAITRLTA